MDNKAIMDLMQEAFILGLEQARGIVLSRMDWTPAVILASIEAKIAFERALAGTNEQYGNALRNLAKGE